jgi:hypothetical protein
LSKDWERSSVCEICFDLRSDSFKSYFERFDLSLDTRQFGFDGVRAFLVVHAVPFDAALILMHHVEEFSLFRQLSNLFPSTVKSGFPPIAGRGRTDESGGPPNAFET